MTAPVNPPSALPSLDCDVLVVGSGAGGLASAVTAAYHGLKVVVVEKADVCGGATSWSGGWAWTPGNPLAKADGVNEDRELFRTYLRHRLGRNYQEDRVEAFLEAAPHMVGFFHDNTSLQFVPGAKIKDIYGSTPGAGTGHRSVGPKPLNARRIRPELRAKMRHQLYETSFLGMGIMAGPDLTKVPLGLPRQHPGHFPRRLAGGLPPPGPRHPPPQHAAGQRNRADRPAADVRR